MIGRLVLAAVAATLLASAATGAAAQPAPAAASAAPATCRVGAFVTSLHGIDTARNRFEADFWLWSLCADAARRPLETMEFFNADEAEKQLGATMTRGPYAWSQVKVLGAFRHRFDLRNYPFDRHRLVITLEEAVEDTGGFAYTADTANSALHEGLKADGWRITGFRVRPGETLYRSSFGDPALPARAPVKFSRLDLEIDLARDQTTSFLKLTVPMYAAAILALISFLMHTEHDARLNPRIAFLGGAMLTVVLNMRGVDEVVGVVEGVGMLDLLHAAVLALIVAATATAIWCGQMIERGADAAAVQRVDRTVFWAAGGVYLLANVAIILAGLAAG